MRHAAAGCAVPDPDAPVIRRDHNLALRGDVARQPRNGVEGLKDACAHGLIPKSIVPDDSELVLPRSVVVVMTAGRMPRSIEPPVASAAKTGSEKMPDDAPLGGNR